jgi:TRAP-type C4-dicarboxylate transport system permease small subunit
MVEWYFILALFAVVVVIAFVINLVKNRKREFDHDPTVTNDDVIKKGRPY